MFAEDSISGGMGVYGEKNLFRRIIRNPMPGGRLPKERECAEMLCGCLMNLPFFQGKFLEWMADRAGQTVDVGALDFRFRTEQPVWTKRDDLRIEGFDENGVRKLLWTVEIKVGAGFHWSTAVESSTRETGEGSDSDGETLQDFVNQLENYDQWLAEQEAKFKAGFVISIWDQKENLPKGLKFSWPCLMWRDVAEVLRVILEEAEVPETEVLWCRHLLGFMEQSLKGLEMENDLRLEEVAFLKALSQQGIPMIEKIKNLVTSVSKKFTSASPISTDLNYDYSKNFHFQRGMIFSFWWPFPGSNSGEPCLCAGINSEHGMTIVVYV
ncbi:MAG: hypothetical protein ACLFQQ_11610 [Desulfococcaceae bacterium]